MAALLAGCARHAPQTTLKPQGPISRSIQHLYVPVFWIAAGVFVLVQGLLLVAVIRYRHRDDRPEPVQVHGNTRLEITWTILPALLLAGIAVPTIKTVFDLSRKPQNALNITVVGHQFWWEYRYTDPGMGFSTATDLHIPTGRDVRITLDGLPSDGNVDVIHSFWIPALNGKTDFIPGRVNHMLLHADHPGVYPGECTEYCGLSHANMRMDAVAQTPADFDAWVAAQRMPAATPADGTPAADGLGLFKIKGCMGCHTINGVSAGMVGPNLTHLQSRTSFAGGILTMTADNLRRWLHDPPGVKPGSKMPNLKLADDEITKLVAYLETLK
jgi:cytochrome c oxidase subunit 2